jgi:hypothetical protein
MFRLCLIFTPTSKIQNDIKPFVLMDWSFFRQEDKKSQLGADFA